MEYSQVAVLIPSFKPCVYVKRCFDSLERQTLDKRSFCVYIALNGPRAPYEERLFDYLSGVNFRYRYIYLEEAGVSEARNQLIEASSEPFLTFLDDDDLISDEFLEKLLQVSSSKFVGVSNVRKFDLSIDDAIENYIGESFLRMQPTVISKFRARKYFSSPCAKIIHRGMVGGVRFDKRLAKGEDALFMAEISVNILGIKKATGDSCYYVYERVGSASRSRIRSSKELFRIFYLSNRYARMLFSGGYDRIFILTRLFATLRNIKKAIFD